MNDTFRTLQEDIICWADARGILSESTAVKQLDKTIEELAELGHALENDDLPGVIDGFGDVLVTLIIAAELENLDLIACLKSAYHEIRNRRGRMIGGIFVKES